jgi:hypothetical protein
MGTGTIEAKLAQQLAHLEQRPFFGVFIDLKKAFDVMDRGRCLTILALHGVGPQMLRLIRNFWETATKVCRAKGNYGRLFKAGRGVTQGGPLSAKLFNILVGAVVREWMRLMRETLDDSDGQLAIRVKELFAIFYVDDGYIATRDDEFPRRHCIQTQRPRHEHEEDAGDGVHAREDKGPTPNRFIQPSEGRICCRGRVKTSSRLSCVRKDPPSPEYLIAPWEHP